MAVLRHKCSMGPCHMHRLHRQAPRRNILVDDAEVVGKEMSELSLFTCGVPKDHKCDDNGPFVYFHRDGHVLLEKPENVVGISGGSVTCSQCGMSAMDRAMWEGP